MDGVGHNPRGIWGVLGGGCEVGPWSQNNYWDSLVRRQRKLLIYLLCHAHGSPADPVRSGMMSSVGGWRWRDVDVGLPNDASWRTRLAASTAGKHLAPQHMQT